MTAVIDESQQCVSSAVCDDCVAAAGGCKHVAALLGWLSSKSSDQSVTSQESYWKKSRLSSVPNELKTATVRQLRPKRRSIDDGEDGSGEAFFNAVMSMQTATGTSCLVLDHFGYDGDARALESVAMDHLLRAYIANVGRLDVSYEGFASFAADLLTPEKCALVREATTAQSECSLWHSVRFGRVTASKAYAVAHCSAENGTVVASLLGAARVKDTAAMRRGRDLEPRVLQAMEKRLGQRISRSGVIISRRHPIFGASPDGVTEDGTIVEVKCPSKDSTMAQYISSDGGVCAKPYAQLQLLMQMAGTTRSYFCVAEPDFEISGAIRVLSVTLDEQYCSGLISACTRFWARTVFVRLCRNYRSV